MASIEYKNSILWRGEDPLKVGFKPVIDASKKVVRYFPGQQPRWSKEEEKKKKAEEEERKKRDREADEDLQRSSRRRRRDPNAAAVVVESAPKEDAASSRMKRLQQNSSSGPIDPSDRMSRHRTIHEARVLEAKDEESKDEAMKEEKEEILRAKKEEEFNDRGPVAQLQIPMYDNISGDEDEDIELRNLRRERARESALARRKHEEDLLKEEVDELAEEEEEDESSYASDSGDDDPRRGGMLKPVFVTKAQRDTVKEREAIEKEEEAAIEKEKARKEEKKAESKTMLVDVIRVIEEAEAAGINENDGSDVELLDDDDEKNEAEEYELWKIRELKRIKRDKEERLARHAELEFIERRRRMTDEEREEDDRRMDSKSTKRDEAKGFNFLQKYYHRGGFFQDKATTGEEPLYNRDYHEPLEEEKFDKTALPKAMQLRRGQFGKKGQVKHTHLTESDTTDMSAAWSQHSKPMQKYQEKMATAKSVNVFDRPGGRSGDD
mmetsp:Transcript_81432/g.206865  ORF Transcript_81432/g.206865 Transcript_81432/m.206865 type:complete len:494 (-) Transcript_81432:169-1650(-)